MAFHIISQIKDLEYEQDRNGLIRVKYEREGPTSLTSVICTVPHSQCGGKAGEILADFMHRRVELLDF